MKLFDQIQAFQKLSPWKWLSDQDIISFPDPDSNETCYCSVMGQMGSCFGLVIYRGDQGLWILSGIMSGEIEFGDYELTYEQDCLMLTFEHKQELDSDDLKLISESGYEPVENTYPVIRSFKPGYFPCLPSEAESKLLSTTLDLVTDFANTYKSSPQKLIQEKELGDDFKVYKSVKSDKGITWETARVGLLDEEPMVAANYVCNNLQALKELPQEEMLWQIGDTHLPKPNKKGKAYFPRCVLIVEKDSGFVFNTTLYTPETSLVEAVGDCLVKAMEKQKCRPTGITLDDPALDSVFESLFKELNIELKPDEDLEMLEESLEEVLQEFER